MEPLSFYGEALRFEIEHQGAHEIFVFRPNPWDALIFERYPSRKDLRTLTESEQHQAATKRLRAGLEDTVVYAIGYGGRENNWADLAGAHRARCKARAPTRRGRAVTDGYRRKKA